MQIERAGMGKGAGEGKKEGKGGTDVGGRDSDEEIVMTGTSYPGQEWRPGGWGAWDGS